MILHSEQPDAFETLQEVVRESDDVSDSTKAILLELIRLCDATGRSIHTRLHGIRAAYELDNLISDQVDGSKNLNDFALPCGLVFSASMIGPRHGERKSRLFVSRTGQLYDNSGIEVFGVSSL